MIDFSYLYWTNLIEPAGRIGRDNPGGRAISESVLRLAWNCPFSIMDFGV